MNKILPFLLIIFLTSTACAGTIYKCDPNNDDYLGSQEVSKASDYGLSNVIVSTNPCPPNGFADAECVITHPNPSIRIDFQKCIDTDANTKYDSVVEKSQAEKDAIIAAENTQVEANLRNTAKAQVDGQNSDALALRCIVDATLDEINVLRTWTRDLEGAFAAANNLADAKANVAALNDLTNRTLSQAKTAVQACVDSGNADE